MTYTDRMNQVIKGEYLHLFGNPRQQFKRRVPRKTTKSRRMFKIVRYLSRSIHGK